PGLLMYQDLAGMACNRITAGITHALEGQRPIKALLDPYNPTGSTAHVRFTTSRADRWDTSGPLAKNHVNWVILDSDWEAEFCRVAESHRRLSVIRKITTWASKCPIATARRSANICPTSSCWWTTDGPSTTCSISSLRSKAIAGRMPRKR